MDRKRGFITWLLLLPALLVFSQQKESVKVHMNHYSLMVGVGWTHYIDNLEYGDNNIRKDFAGVSMQFFWEPEHRLSLGLESGYYHMFNVSGEVTGISAKVTRAVTPMLLLVRMRVINHFYIGAGMGLALITNKVMAGSDKIVTKTWSLSNYKGTISYLYPLAKHWRVGGEANIFNYGNLNDWMYSVQALCAFRF